MAPLFINIKSIIAGMNTVVFKNGSYHINYRSAPLDKIFKEIENEFQITIAGLNSRRSESISLSINDESVDGILKKLIKSIGEKNYAFIYITEKLTTLYFVPESEFDFIPFKEKTKTDIHKKNYFGAIVTSIFDNSFMHSAELRTGDIITEYDNVRITKGPIELSKLMKERSDRNSIEMRILRDNVPMSIFVTGGLINAGLKTIAIGDTDF
jgi:C-terminal processing protease CtpA/Prc